VWDEWNTYLMSAIDPSEELTVDEMLSLFRGHCPFRVYVKCKPGKYGFMIRMLSDAKHRMVLNTSPYVGYNVGEEKQTMSETCENLLKPYFNTGRNVTVDRGYTDIRLARSLKVIDAAF
jgi:Transposase IS4